MAARLRAVSAERYHPVTIAIDKAQAALWLLGELQHGDLAGQLGVGPVTVQPGPEMKLPPEEIHGWLTGLAFDTIEDALVEARAEFVKTRTPAPGGG